MNDDSAPTAESTGWEASRSSSSSRVQVATRLRAAVYRSVRWLRRHAPGAGWQAVAQWAAFLAFVAARVATFWGQKPFVGGDHGVWLSCGGGAFFNERLWTCHRPPVVPLVHKLFDFDELAVMWLQVAASTLAWALLAWVASAFVQNAAIRVIAFASLLVLGMVAPFHAWDFSVRSESLAHTFALGAVAFAMIAIAARPGVMTPRAALPALVATVVTGWLAVHSRDLNALWVLGVAVLLVVGIFPGDGWRTRAVRFGVTAGALVVAALLGSWGTVASGRHEKPFAHVVMQQVLTDAQRTEIFRRELGMPYDEHVARLAGEWYSKWDERIRTHAEYADFHGWLLGDGFASYRGYLLRHIDETAPEALRSLQRTVRSKHASDMREPAADTPTGWVTSMWNRFSPMLEFPNATAGAALVVCMALSVRRDWRRRVLPLLGAFFVAMGLGMAFFAYHADALEVARHSVFAVCSISLGAWIGVVALLDCAVSLLPLPRVRRTTVGFSSAADDSTAWGRALVGATLAVVVVAIATAGAKASTRYPNLAATAEVEVHRGRGDVDALLHGSAVPYCLNGTREDPAYLRLRFGKEGTPTRMFVFTEQRAGFDVRSGSNARHLQPASTGSSPRRAVRFEEGAARVAEIRTTSNQAACLTAVRMH
jgi:hypothetical protein